MTQPTDTRQANAHGAGVEMSEAKPVGYVCQGTIAWLASGERLVGHIYSISTTDDQEALYAAPPAVNRTPAFEAMKAALAELLEIAACWETLDSRKNIQLDNSDTVKRARAALKLAEDSDNG